MDDIDKKVVVSRINDAKSRLLLISPFFGNLLLHLRFSIAKCGTACTDMKRIVFDPEFVIRLSVEETMFVIMHEIMHCALQHCVRRNGRDKYIYNLACDIVVNSTILRALGRDQLSVDGSDVIHTTPDGFEGYIFSAEEVYEALSNEYDIKLEDVNCVYSQMMSEYGMPIDDHGIWETVSSSELLTGNWVKNVLDAVNVAGKDLCPLGIRNFLNDYDYQVKVNWRAVLNDFVHEIANKYDYSFVPPDRRFAEDFILPSFSVIPDSSCVENIWFVIDSSGSVDDVALTQAYAEIKGAMEQFDVLHGKLSFFDCAVTDPVDFSSFDELDSLKPKGGGGTSFKAIFNYMKQNMADNLPIAIVILTDGYDVYPDENVAMGVPVLWIIVDTDIHNDAPWGITVHI